MVRVSLKGNLCLHLVALRPLGDPLFSPGSVLVVSSRAWGTQAALGEALASGRHPRRLLLSPFLAEPLLPAGTRPFSQTNVTGK